MKTKSTAITVIIAILAVGFAIWKFNSRSDQPAPSGQTGTSMPNQQTSTNTENSTGIVSAGADGKSVYTNETLGVKFSFPQTWRIGDNRLGYSTFQIFNYSESEETGKSVFLPNQNKIQASINDSNITEPSSDYPEESRTTTQVEIAGQSATKVDVNYGGNDKKLTYYIPLPSLPGKFLTFVIYGDPANFSALDDLVKSLELTKI